MQNICYFVVAPHSCISAIFSKAIICDLLCESRQYHLKQLETPVFLIVTKFEMSKTPAYSVIKDRHWLRRRFFYLSRFAKTDQNVSVKFFKFQCVNNDYFITFIQLLNQYYTHNSFDISSFLIEDIILRNIGKTIIEW